MLSNSTLQLCLSTDKSDSASSKRIGNRKYYCCYLKQLDFVEYYQRHFDIPIN